MFGYTPHTWEDHPTRPGAKLCSRCNAFVFTKDGQPLRYSAYLHTEYASVDCDYEVKLLIMDVLES